MKRNVLCIAVMLLSQVAPAGDVPAPASRGYRSSIQVGGNEVLELEIRSPRIPQAELSKIIAVPELLRTINERHLRALGVARLHQPCRIGGTFVDAGSYRLGIEIAADGTLAVILGGDEAEVRIALRQVDGGDGVSQVAIALLPREDLEEYDLEVRCAGLRALAPADFNIKRLIVSLNNSAQDLLDRADGSARIDPRATAMALRLSARANALTGGENPLILDTLALALFHNGRVDDAIRTQQAAIERLDPAQLDHQSLMTTRLRAFELARVK